MLAAGHARIRREIGGAVGGGSGPGSQIWFPTSGGPDLQKNIFLKKICAVIPTIAYRYDNFCSGAHPVSELHILLYTHRVHLHYNMYIVHVLCIYRYVHGGRVSRRAFTTIYAISTLCCSWPGKSARRALNNLSFSHNPYPPSAHPSSFYTCRCTNCLFV